jgi:hypothetical protein
MSYPQKSGELPCYPRFERQGTAPFTQASERAKSLIQQEKGRLSTPDSALYYYCYFVFKDLEE